MSLRCLLGVHRPNSASIIRRGLGYVALCETCARPLERTEQGKWTASDPLYQPGSRSG